MALVLLVLSVLFFAASMVFAMFGLGGGLFYAPILVLSGFHVRTAAFTSLAVILATSTAAFIVFKRAGKVSWKLAAVVDPPTDVMAFVGGYYAYLIDREAALTILVVTMILAGLLMVRRETTLRRGALPFMNLTIRHGDERYVVNLPTTVAATGSIGFIAGVVGITGGVFKVPIMVLLCGVPMDVAVATSSFMVLLTALFGFAGHLCARVSLSAELDVVFLAALVIAAFLGGILGASKSLKVGRARLRRGFGFLLLVLAALITARELLWMLAS